MRTPIIAGNWKMNKTPAESVAFAEALLPAINDLAGAEKVVIPTYVALPGVNQALAGSQIRVGAQDCHPEPSGAYTSSIAAPMLVGLAEYVVIGHSETRQYLGVTDEQVNGKLKAALAAGLKPIVALGEVLEQRRAGQHREVCQTQLRAALDGIPAEAIPGLVIAYEPVWAIGTGENASVADAEEIIGGVLRPTVAELYGQPAADAVRIQYGGSVKPDNMAEYMALPDIDGALVGGASLKMDSFAELIRLAIQAKGG
ncbi:MAG: triose-phosphate isomerase [Anaerolineae bacterium]|nr:triose-phosphate isomerase [Anaerolineae bacterium]